MKLTAFRVQVLLSLLGVGALIAGIVTGDKGFNIMTSVYVTGALVVSAMIGLKVHGE